MLTLSRPQVSGGALDEATSSGGWLIVIGASAVQPFASVMVKVYEPAGRINVPIPIYGGVPPVPVTTTVASSPLQRMVVAVAVAARSGGSVSVAMTVSAQPFASVTMNE